MITKTDLESLIQLPPWKNETAKFFDSSEGNYESGKLFAMKQWLALSGMPEEKLLTLTRQQVERCYSIKNYYDTVIGKRPRKLSTPKNSKVQHANLIINVEEEDENKEKINQVYGDYNAELASANSQQSSQNSYPVQNPYDDEKHFLQKSSHELAFEQRLDLLKQDLQQEAKSLAREYINAAKLQNENQIKDFLKTQERPREIIIKNPQTFETQNLGYQHKDFELLLKALSCKLHIMLVGAASSSKTTSAANAAMALNVPFYHMGAAASEFKFAGYEDGNGKYHTTPFRMAFENGGVILLDEYDASIPAATMFIQAALANQTCHFPDKIISAHKDFYCIVACNTYGRGSDRIYVSRNQQDGAALDRFIVINWDIDEDLEANLFGDGIKNVNYSPYPNDYFLEPTQIPHISPGDWVRRVQTIRKTINELGERHLVTMRASDYGGRLLKIGLSLQKTEELCIWKGLNESIVNKIKHHSKIEYPLPKLNPIDPPPTDSYTDFEYKTQKEQWEAFTQKINNKDKILAIIIWRERFPLDNLKIAKDYVEDIIDKRVKMPSLQEWEQGWFNYNSQVSISKLKGEPECPAKQIAQIPKPA